MLHFVNSTRRAAIIAAVAAAAFGPANAQNPAITVSVDANANRKAINPNVYGVCAYPYDTLTSTANLNSMNCPLVREGGNSATVYNWNLNCDNRGSDYFFISYGDSSATPGQRLDALTSVDNGANAKTMITIPLIGYVANLAANRASLWSFSIAKYGPQTSHESSLTDAGNGVSTATGNPNITGNNPLDAMVSSTPAMQQSWVNHLVSKFGNASTSTGVKYYIMDNEPMIWQGTHRDIHPVGAKMDEIYNDIVNYAGAVKTADPNALVAGPEEWGWSNYFGSGYDTQNPGNTDRAAHGGMDYYPWLLQQLQAYQNTNGKRLLDVLTLHAYPYLGEAFSNDESAAMQANRNRETRYYWDPAYTDPSWVNTVTQLIPRMKGWVNTYYPDTQTGITEYNWGDDNGINGATCQADILGIFGREGLDLATRWTMPDPTSMVFKSFQMYRNYDGAKSTFGDTSVSCTVPNADNQSAFAAQRSSDNALTVMVINKIAGTTPLTLSLANFSAASPAHRYQLTSAGTITHLADLAFSGGTMSDTLASQSITLYIIPKAVSTESAFNGSCGAAAWAIPGTIQSENYDCGGEGVAYHDSDSSNNGGQYRTSDGVDIETTADTGGGYDVGWTAVGEYMKYTCNVTAGTYNINFRVAGTAAGACHIEDTNGTNLTGSVAIPSTGGWQTWSTVTKTGIALTGGTHTFKFVVDTAGYNINYISFTSAGSAPPAPTGLTATPTDAQNALAWNASTGATSYNVYRGTSAGGESGTAIATGLTGTSYTNTGLTDGTNYFYTVKAVNASGSSGASNESSGLPAQFNFESGVQAWTFNAAPITGVAQSTTQAFGRTHALAVTINGAAGTADALLNGPSTAAGKTISYRVWIPSGSQVTQIQVYEMDHNWLWTGNIVPIGSLTTNAWNTVTVTVPTTAVLPLQQCGVEFKTGATWAGTCYIDSVSW